jgi:branched-chain amino acid transport system permease protein
VDFALITLLNGVTYGLLLFMLSSGLTLIFSMMGILNFAHASFYMLGAYFAFEVSRRVGFGPALLVAPLLTGAVGALVQHHGLRRVRRHGHVAELLFTFGLFFVVDDLVQLVWGKANVEYKVPALFDGTLFRIGASAFPIYRGFMMVVSVAILAGLYLLLTRTRVGLVIRAALDRPDMVQALGHDVPRIFTLVFAAGAALAGLAGVIGGNAFVTEPGMAAAVGPIVFVVVVVGGMGSLGGAFLASLLIGVLQTFMVSIDFSALDLARRLGVHLEATPALARLSFTQLAPVMPYLLMVAILIFRPRGLMGTRET